MKSTFVVQVPEIYKEMESSGCTPDRKARQMLQVALMVLEQRGLYVGKPTED